jgi:hypothetical protein
MRSSTGAPESKDGPNEWTPRVASVGRARIDASIPTLANDRAFARML